MTKQRSEKIVSYANDLRNNMTLEEKKLWFQFLRVYCIPFSRQKILGKYIADFYCDKAKLVVELDGPTHYTEEGQLHDEVRTEYLKRFNIVVIRISNLAVLHNFDDVCWRIDNVVRNRLDELGEEYP